MSIQPGRDADGKLARAMRVGALVLASGPFFGLIGCASLGPPTPEAGYRARVHVSLTDPATGRVEHIAMAEDYALGKRRRSSIGQVDAPIVIERPDLQVTWTLDPRTNVVAERSIGEAAASPEALPDPFGPGSGAGFDWIATETFEGVRADRYAVSGGGYEGTAWLALDRIPLRFEGRFVRAERTTAIEIRYREIRRMRLREGLFEVPSSYAGNKVLKRKLQQRQESVDEAARIMRDQMNTAPRAPMTNPVPVF